MIIRRLICYLWEWVTDLIRNMTSRAFESTIWIFPDMKDLTCEYIFTKREEINNLLHLNVKRSCWRCITRLPESLGKASTGIQFSRSPSETWSIHSYLQPYHTRGTAGKLTELDMSGVLWVHAESKLELVFIHLITETDLCLGEP